MSDKIKRWGITWKESTLTNAVVSLGINGDLGLAIMMSHGMTLLALTPVNEKTWLDALAALVVVYLIRPSKGDDDYIAVILDATVCHMELCASAQERGLQLSEGFADDCEDVIIAFKTVEAAIEQVNKEHAEAMTKPSKRPHTKRVTPLSGRKKLATRQLLQKSPLSLSGKIQAPVESGRLQKVKSLREN